MQNKNPGLNFTGYTFNYTLMNMFKKLENYCRNITNISDEEWETFVSKFEVFHLKKNEHFIQMGDIENYVYFLNSGIVRVYTTYQEKNISTFFFFENNFFSSFQSLLKQQPSILGYHSITDIESLRIHKKDLNTMYDQYQSIDRLGRIIVQEKFLELHNHNLDLLSMTVEDRYNNMFKMYHHLIQHIPVKYLASFLGIHQNSLSRIRRKK